MIDNNLLISAKNIKKTYITETEEQSAPVEVLKGIDLDIQVGESLCIMGSSGAGKSTLLHILGALDRPTEGQLFFRRQNLSTFTDDQLSEFRNRTMGFVFQFHHLLSEFTALENVMMPALIANMNFRESRVEAERLLDELGLQKRHQHRPSALSGGEQQRVAIARALIRQPAIIYADEPTGNLDQKNGQQVQDLLFDLQKKRRLTLVVVTHDSDLAKRFPKTRVMRDGKWT